jgi:hypothetical protein
MEKGSLDSELPILGGQLINDPLLFLGCQMLAGRLELDCKIAAW